MAYSSGDDYDEHSVEEDKKDEFDIDVSEDEDYQECVINLGNDRRKIICDSQNKNDDIIKCFGSVEVHFIPDATIAQPESIHGTGTVIYIDSNNLIYVLTAAHNVRAVERKCRSCNTKTLRRKCKNKKCDSNPRTVKTGKLVSPNDIFFDRRGNGTDNNKLGQSIARYQGEAYRIPEKYPDKWTEFATPKGGFDICIITFKCNDTNGKQLYKNVCSKINLMVNDESFGNNNSVYVYGYPGCYRAEKDHRTYYYLYGMGTSKINAKNTFTVSTNSETNKKYIVNKGIDTTVGQSGACIYSYGNDNIPLNRKAFLIYGVHTGGSPIKHCNFGTFLDIDIMNWIKNVMIDFGGKNVGNINKIFIVKESKKKFTPKTISTSGKKVGTSVGKGGLLAKVVLGKNWKKQKNSSQTPTVTHSSNETFSRASHSHSHSFSSSIYSKIVNELKCELVKDDKALKVVKLFDAFDKYFDAIQGDDGEGLIVSKYISDTFKDTGVCIGWKLSKLGGRYVDKKKFILLKRQLISKARFAKKMGYELTFVNEAEQHGKSTPTSPQQSVAKTVLSKTVSADEAQKYSVSTPTSPNKNTIENNNNNIPSTVPLNPVPSLMSPETKAEQNNQNEKTMKPLNINQNKGRYKALKTCEMVQEIDANTKKIKLFQDYTKFFSAEGKKEFVVANMQTNEYGIALSKLGISQGWKITECNNKKLGPKMFVMLKNKISDAARKNGVNGYVVIFENSNAKTNIKTVKSAAATTALNSEAKRNSNNVSAVTTKTWNNKDIDDWNNKDVDDWICSIGLVANVARQITDILGEQQITGKDFNSMKEVSDIVDALEINRMYATKIFNALKGVKKDKKQQPKQLKTALNSEAKRNDNNVSAINTKTGQTKFGGVPAVGGLLAKSDSLRQKLKKQVNKSSNVNEQKRTHVKKNSTELAPATTSTISQLQVTAQISQTDEAEKKEDNVSPKIKKTASGYVFRYEAPKSCELLNDMGNEKTIRLYQEYGKYFSVKPCEGNKGIVVDNMTTNEFSSALSELGIGKGWRIIQCENKKLGNKMFAMLKNQITAFGKKNSANGYVLIFENQNKNTSKPTGSTAKPIDYEEKKSEPPQKIISAPVTQTGAINSQNGNKLRCELVQDKMGLKVVRLYDTFEKYFKGIKGTNNKGLIVNAVIADEFKSTGVEIGWELIKLGKNNVEKNSFAMLRRQLLTQSTLGKEKGYEVTFAKS